MEEYQEYSLSGRVFHKLRDDILICDPEGEYFPLVQALKGQVARLATNSKDFLNPMDIQLSHRGDKEALKLKSDFIQKLYSVLIECIKVIWYEIDNENEINVFTKVSALSSSSV